MKESVRIFRFAVIGTLNALITAFVIWLMMDELSYDYIPANITAYIVAQIHNFIWSKYWIFPIENKKNNIWKQMLFFCSAFGLAYSAQFLFLVTLVECGDVNEYLAQFLGLFIYGTVNFIVNKKLTFRYSSILRSRRNGHQRRTFSERSRSTSTIIFSERSFPA